MIREMDIDELYLLKMYAADNVEELMELLENARHFASDSISSDAISNLMLKAAYLTDEELKELQKQ